MTCKCGHRVKNHAKGGCRGRITGAGGEWKCLCNKYVEKRTEGTFKHTLYVVHCKGKHKTGVKLEGFLKERPDSDFRTLRVNEDIRFAWFSESEAFMEQGVQDIR